MLNLSFILSFFLFLIELFFFGFCLQIRANNHICGKMLCAIQGPSRISESVLVNGEEVPPWLPVLASPCQRVWHLRTRAIVFPACGSFPLVCVSLSLFLSLSLSFSLCLFLCVHVSSVCVSVCLRFYVFMCLRACVSMCLCVCVSLSLSLCLFLVSVCLCVCVSVS